VGLERSHAYTVFERERSERQKIHLDQYIPTAWNQIEAAMAYGRGLPLLVLVDQQLRCDGLLERGNDWFVHEVPLDPAALNNPAFTGLLKDWRDRIEQRTATAAAATAAPAAAARDPASMTVAELVGALKPFQLWTALVALAGALSGAFYLGLRLGSG